MRSQPLTRRPDESGARAGAHPGNVTAQVPLEQREHRCLVHHAVEPALAVAAERAARRIRLPVGEPRLPQRGRVQHAGMQRGVVEHGRAARHRLIQLRPGWVPALAELVLRIPAPGHPGALRSPVSGFLEPRLNRRDLGRRWLAAVRRRREVADIGHMTMRVDQARDDGSPAEAQHCGAGRGRANSLGLPYGSDPAVPDQHGTSRPGVRCHRDEDAVLNDQLHHPASRAEQYIRPAARAKAWWQPARIPSHRQPAPVPASRHAPRSGDPDPACLPLVIAVISGKFMSERIDVRADIKIAGPSGDAVRGEATARTWRVPAGQAIRSPAGAVAHRVSGGGGVRG